MDTISQHWLLRGLQGAASLAAMLAVARLVAASVAFLTTWGQIVLGAAAGMAAGLAVFVAIGLVSEWASTLLRRFDTSQPPDESTAAVDQSHGRQRE